MMQLQLFPLLLIAGLGAGPATVEVDTLVAARADSVLQLAREERGDRALELLREALDLARRSGDPRARTRVVSSYARQLQRQQAYPEAIEAYEESAALADSLSEPGFASGERVLAAGLMVEVGRLAEGRALLERALNDARASDDPEAEAEVLYHLARGHHRLGEFERALENCEEIQRLHAEHGLPLRARSRGRLVQSRVLLDTGRLREALRTLEAMEADADSLGGSWPALVLNAKANVLTELGDLPSSLERYERVRELSRERGDPLRVAIAEGNIAGCLSRVGRYQEAIESYRRCAEVFESVGHTSNLALSHLNLANVQIRVGDLDAALVEAELAREMFERTGAAARANSARLTMVDILIEGGDLERAHREATASLEEAEGFEGDVLRALFSLSKIDAQRGDWPAAEQRLRTILARTAESGELLQRGRAFAVLGEVERAQGSLDSATVHLARSVELIDRLGSSRYAVHPLVEWGRSLYDGGETDAALRRFEDAIDHVERIRWAAGAESGRWSVLGDNFDPYAEAAHCLLESNRVEEAFARIESSRARTLLDRLAQLDVDLDARVPEELRRRRKEILARIAFVQTQAESGDDTEAQLTRLESEYAEVEGEIRGVQSPFRALRHFVPARIDEVKRRLGPNALLLEFVFHGDHAWCLSLDAEGARAHRLPADVGTKVQTLREELEKGRQPNRVDLDLAARLQHELYEALVAPSLRERAAPVKVLVVAPDGPLWTLPIECLLTEPAPSPLVAGDLTDLPFLFRKIDVHVVPSATVWLRLPNEVARTSTGGTLLVADPEHAIPQAEFAALPSTRDEARAVVAALGSDAVTMLEGREATEEAFEAADLGDLDCLHLAAHARVDEDHPQRTAVVLRLDDDPREDGLLTLRDIYDLDLHADLVVLSTCNSAVGRRVRGEGPVALARAFLAVGARRTLVSLWPVQDRSTAEFMAAFHRERARGTDDAEALRRARLALLDSGRPAWRLPYHWASFVLVGGP